MKLSSLVPFRKRNSQNKDDKRRKNSADLSASGDLKVGPGARSVGPDMAVYRVMVPEGIEPGQEFQANAGGRIVRVRCPPGVIPGRALQITVPVDPTPTPDLPTDEIVERTDDDPSGNPAYMVTIPPNVVGGQKFQVTIQGQQLMITAPPNSQPGSKVRVVPPPLPKTTDITSAPEQTSSPSRTQSTSSANSMNGSVNTNGGSSTSTNGAKPNNNTNGATPTRPPQRNKSNDTQLFEVQVPPGVKPGQPFALLAGGVRVLVTCPVNAGPGKRIRFKLPLVLVQAANKKLDPVTKIKLSYDKDGWTRTIRVSDMKFQWVRMDDKGDVDSQIRFSVTKSAYVRKLEFRPGPDVRIRDGILSLVPAVEASCASCIKGAEDEILVNYADIAEAQVKNFEDKAHWFQEKCSKLAVEWNEGHMRINVRRSDLLEDSVNAVMSLSRKDLRKKWRFEFIGEAGLDAGGLAREWFHLVTQDVFDPMRGLWKSSATNQMCMQINPESKFLFDDYLVYYRFLGRVMGKALFDRQLVSGHMVQFIYKHMLGWPVQFKDLEMIDEEYYNNLKQLQQLADSGEDLEMLCLDFTMTEDLMGMKEEFELIPNGKDTELTNDNFPEYLEACLKYRFLEVVKPQLNEVLLGFFDVIPEPLLTVFDFQELELLMCGLPEIDMEDWKNHTDYMGEINGFGPDFPVCQWFWEVVGDDFDQEMKARLLQFVTGTSGVPSRGFGVLQGTDGNIRQFTIHGVPVEQCLYPRAHTCFNRIDLPLYKSKEDLREKLQLAVTMVATGFDIE